jgi:hypothetical protein
VITASSLKLNLQLLFKTTGGKINANIVLMGKTGGRTPPASLKSRWHNSIKMDLRR